MKLSLDHCLRIETVSWRFHISHSLLHGPFLTIYCVCFAIKVDKQFRAERYAKHRCIELTQSCECLQTMLESSKNGFALLKLGSGLYDSDSWPWWKEIYDRKILQYRKSKISFLNPSRWHTLSLHILVQFGMFLAPNCLRSLPGVNSVYRFSLLSRHQRIGYIGFYFSILLDLPTKLQAPLDFDLWVLFAHPGFFIWIYNLDMCTAIKIVSTIICMRQHKSSFASTIS